MKRHGGDLRGNTRNRRARKLFLLTAWGTGKSCRCVYCGKRLIPGCAGGRYVRSNIVPACLTCNRARYTRPKGMVVRYRPADYTLREFRQVIQGL